ncbi:hypothetical protein DFH06DRAFT_1139701 [Mycena polygramma]|nr:hypothetical protein DFH06DRAFT_1139701 [Mycena polygramma]
MYPSVDVQGKIPPGEAGFKLGVGQSVEAVDQGRDVRIVEGRYYGRAVALVKINGTMIRGVTFKFGLGEDEDDPPRTQTHGRKVNRRRPVRSASLLKQPGPHRHFSIFSFAFSLAFMGLGPWRLFSAEHEIQSRRLRSGPGLVQKSAWLQRVRGFWQDPEKT